jgi:uncharacterized protein (DUF2336 family)
MADAAPRLHNLLALAAEPSSEKRRELLEGVAELFFDAPEQHNARETELFGDVLAMAAKRVEMDVRRRLAERLAEAPSAPRHLVSLLANDSIEVARPLLTKSGVLEDADLLEIVRRRGQGHMLAVSMRPKVSAEVAGALVERGDVSVLESLARNQGAELTRDAMEALVARSETEERLRQPLVTRADLPPDLMHEMFWWVSRALREYIVTRARMDPKAVDALLADAQASFRSEVEAQEATLTRAEKAIRRMARLGQLRPDYLVQLLRQGSVQEFVLGFAWLVDVDPQTARRIAFDPGREAVAVACRAAEFPLQTFSSIVLLLDTLAQRGEGKPKKMSAVAQLIELYNKLPVDAARRAMRFWRLKKQGRDRPGGAAPEAA